MSPKFTTSQRPLPWGLEEITALAHSDRKAVRVFVRKLLPWAAWAIRGRRWGGYIAAWPYQNFYAVLDHYHSLWECEEPTPEQEEEMTRQNNWHEFLFKNRIAHLAEMPFNKWEESTRRLDYQQFLSENTTQLDEKLATHAAAILQCGTLAEAVERILHRPLLQSERAMCPEKKVSASDKAWAALCGAYGRHEISLPTYVWSSIHQQLVDGVGLFHRVILAFNEDHPPREQDMDELWGFSAYLTLPYLDETTVRGGGIVYRVCVFSVQEDENPEFVVPNLLAPAAFDVMKMIERYSHERGPLQVVTCHNPMCGKQFFSRRKGAVTCIRPPRSGRRSPCKSVWEAYQKWLRKVRPGENPELIWNRSDLKRSFLAKYTPREQQAFLD